MEQATKDRIGRAFVGALAAAFTLCLVYSYYALWTAHVRATVVSPDTPGSEGRLIIAAVLASLATLAATLLSWWDRRKSLKNEREKKALELRATAAFEMWKAATTAYRLIGNAESGMFSRNNKDTLQKAFIEAEKQTLLFDNKLVLSFQTLWQMSDALCETLLPPNGTSANQSSIWQSKIKEYAEVYSELKQQLNASLVA